jgi:hypothetical protein
MANIAKIYTPKYVIQNPAEVFIDVQAPPSAVPPVQGTNIWEGGAGTYQIDANGQPTDNGANGVYAGATAGPLDISSALKFDPIRSDAHAAAIDAAFISGLTDWDFVANELLLSNLAKLMPFGGAYTSVVAGANPACDFLQIGSPQNSAVTFHTIMFTSPDHGASGKYFVGMLYRALVIGSIPLMFERKKIVQMKVKVRGYLDVTRVAGDMVGQLVKTL